MNKENSVLSLYVTKAIYEADRPYRYPNDEAHEGSGFIIDIVKGLVATNAHVVSDAISIVGRLPRTGKRDLSLEVLGISREKDLAVCKISSEDISLITQGMKKTDYHLLNLTFGDSMKVKAGDSVITLGYPLGQENIKITTGVISGFEIVPEESNELSEIEDSYLRSPSYIQISAAINPGNSGGPLLNSKGEVIGINAAGYLYAQNIGFAIPSRTFLAIYSELISSPFLKMPTLGLEWCKTSRELMKMQTGSSATYGIYVRSFYPDSCFDLLQKGDIIRRLDYVDMFWNRNGESSNLSPIKDLKTNGTVVTVFFDRFGMTNKIGMLKNVDEPDDTKIEFERIFTDRRMTLGEVMDMVPIGTKLTLNICREQNWYKLKTDYIFVESDRIPHIYPRIHPYDYEIVAGICVCNLDMAHIQLFENLSCFLDDSKNRYQKHVVIVQVFPDTNAFKTQVLKPGHLIKSILGYNSNFELISDSHRAILSLEDVRHILHLRPDILQITTTDDCTFMVSASIFMKQDQNVLKNYQISHKYLFD